MATPSIEVVRRLPDGNWLFRVDGVELQTITLEQKRLMLTTQAERDSFALQIAALKDQVKILEAIKDTDARIEANQATQIARMDEMLTATNDVLLRTKDAADACRSAMKVGKVAGALNHPAVKIVALVLPFVFARR